MCLSRLDSDIGLPRHNDVPLSTLENAGAPYPLSAKRVLSHAGIPLPVRLNLDPPPLRVLENVPPKISKMTTDLDKGGAASLTQLKLKNSGKNALVVASTTSQTRASTSRELPLQVPVVEIPVFQPIIPPTAVTDFPGTLHIAATDLPVAPPIAVTGLHVAPPAAFMDLPVELPAEVEDITPEPAFTEQELLEILPPELLAEARAQLHRINNRGNDAGRDVGTDGQQRDGAVVTEPLVREDDIVVERYEDAIVVEAEPMREKTAEEQREEWVDQVVSS